LCSVLTLYLKYLSMNSTPNCLPSCEQVFFVHYQCDFFEEGTSIHDLHIYAHGKLKEFTGKDEKMFLKKYTDRVQELMKEGLIPVHWNQNRPHYGPDHINARYEELTGEELNLEYCRDINLAEILKEIYGDDYITDNSRRLDRIAELNQFHGSMDDKNTAVRVLHANRTLLLFRIYRRMLENRLNTDKSSALPHNQAKKTSTDIKTTSGTKEFSDYLVHTQKLELASAIKKEFSTEKGKQMRYLVEALKNTQPPILSFCRGDGMKLYNAMKEFFDQNIGSYNSIFDHETKYLNKNNINVMQNRLDFILKGIQEQK
jgi:uncharacterized protein YukE